MTAPTITVLDPTADVPQPSPEDVDRPLPDLAGARISLLDNGKVGSDRFLATLAGLLEADGAEVLRTIRKPGVSSLVPADQLAESRRDTDVVVTGVGDCAGCCSCSVQDAIAFERAGTPAVLICTDEMVTTGRIAAAAAGAPDFPFVVIRHPVASCGPDELAERARVALAQIRERVQRSADGGVPPC